MTDEELQNVAVGMMGSLPDKMMGRLMDCLRYVRNACQPPKLTEAALCAIEGRLGDIVSLEWNENTSSGGGWPPDEDGGFYRADGHVYGDGTSHSFDLHVWTRESDDFPDSAISIQEGYLAPRMADLIAHVPADLRTLLATLAERDELIHRLTQDGSATLDLGKQIGRGEMLEAFDRMHGAAATWAEVRNFMLASGDTLQTPPAQARAEARRLRKVLRSIAGAFESGGASQSVLLCVCQEARKALEGGDDA